MNQDNTPDVSSQSEDILHKIEDLANSDDFFATYEFLDELSEKGNHEMFVKACEAGLCDCEIFYVRTNILIQACSNGNFRLAKDLVDYGCNIKSKDMYGQSPLTVASAAGALEIVKYLISAGADKEIGDLSGNTPLINASRNDQLEVVKYLISIGADKEVGGYRTPLFSALENNHPEVVQYLISVGANIKLLNSNGYSPLMYASCNGYTEIVKCLIDAGATLKFLLLESDTPVNFYKSSLIQLPDWRHSL